MTHHTLFVCALCRYPAAAAEPADGPGGQQLIHQLEQALAAQPGPQPLDLQPVRCMAACDRGCNLSLAAPGKLTFILQGLSPQTAAPAVVEFCRQYAASEDGRVPYASRSAVVKQATAYVLPPLPPQG